MKIKFKLSIFLVFIHIISGSAKELEGDLIIKNVNIVNVLDGSVSRSMDILIIRDRITEILNHDNSSTYKAFEVINGEGQFLIPGLWDMHTHSWWAYEYFFPMLLVNGVTGIREMWGEQTEIDKIRIGITNGSIKGPDIFSAGPIIDGSPPLWKGSDSADSPERGREFVRKQKAEGADFIKVYTFLERAVYFAIADECKKQGISFGGHIPLKISLEEALNSGQISLEHFFGILEFCSSQKESLYSSMINENNEEKNDTLFEPRKFSTFLNRMKFETETFDRSKLPELVTLLSQSNSWICPTLVAAEGSINRSLPDFKPMEEIKFMPDFAVENWNPKVDTSKADLQNRNRQIESDWYALVTSVFRTMLDGDVKFLAGTDFPNPYCYPGYSLHEELRLFVEKCGFTPLEALQTATINPAVFLKMDNELGTVEINKKANFVLLGSDPLENINNTKNINGIILRGKFHAQSELKDSLKLKTR
ncbi:MAG TPA: amidohydrolase family protein [Ignavibacteria bacterium]|nr:amidohydrolase family protein [Ignavibacteria bacterium]HQY53411.1 amidohydrolase family protein [Ignavibacteria bacterium]